MTCSSRFLFLIFLSLLSYFSYGQEHDLETDRVFLVDGYNTADFADLVVDDKGNSYVAVNYQSRLSIPELNLQLPVGRHVSRVILKLSPEGKALWALPFSGDWDGRTTAMALAENGDLLITGFCDDVSTYPSTDPNQGDLKVGQPKSKEQYHRNQYAFIARYTANGERVWVKCTSSNEV